MIIGMRLDSPDAKPPHRAHPGDAGADLFSVEDEFLAGQGGRALISTGIAIGIPEGFVGYICPRSGMANDKGITVLNAPGVIDSGYRGELKVNLINHGMFGKWINKGDKIAQLVIQRIETPGFYEVSNFARTDRNTNGHGSTGS